MPLNQKLQAPRNRRETIRDERTGKLKGFSWNSDRFFSRIFIGPKRNPPEWVQDRATLWNAAASKTAKDAREG